MRTVFFSLLTGTALLLLAADPARAHPPTSWGYGRPSYPHPGYGTRYGQQHHHGWSYGYSYGYGYRPPMYQSPYPYRSSSYLTGYLYPYRSYPSYPANWYPPYSSYSYSRSHQYYGHPGAWYGRGGYIQVGGPGGYVIIGR